VNLFSDAEVIALSSTAFFSLSFPSGFLSRLGLPPCF
jgi:hypothetical protein